MRCCKLLIVHIIECLSISSLAEICMYYCVPPPPPCDCTWGILWFSHHLNLCPHPPHPQTLHISHDNVKNLHWLFPYITYKCVDSWKVRWIQSGYWRITQFPLIAKNVTDNNYVYYIPVLICWDIKLD